MDGFGIVRPRRRLTAYAKAVRQARIFARLRDGWAYDDIARDKPLSTKRVRQIVSEALRRRPVSHDFLSDVQDEPQPFRLATYIGRGSLARRPDQCRGHVEGEA
jgi:hypothetical protein